MDCLTAAQLSLARHLIFFFSKNSYDFVYDFKVREKIEDMNFALFMPDLQTQA